MSKPKQAASAQAAAPFAAANSQAVQAVMNSDPIAVGAVIGSPIGEQLGKAADALRQEGARPGLRVVSRAGYFRRAGREFSVEPVEIPADELSEEQLAALESESRLVCTRIFMSAPAEASQE